MHAQPVMGAQSIDSTWILGKISGSKYKGEKKKKWKCRENLTCPGKLYVTSYGGYKTGDSGKERALEKKTGARTKGFVCTTKDLGLQLSGI